MSTLRVSKNLVVHHHEFIIVCCITQLCTIVQMCPAAAGQTVGPIRHFSHSFDQIISGPINVQFISKVAYVLPVTWPLLLYGFNLNLNMPTNFSAIPQYQT